MLKEVVIMLNYAPVKNESYYAQNYANIMCQGLVRGIVKAWRNLIRELENISLSVDNMYTTILGIYTACSYASICMYICVHCSVEIYVAYFITFIS